MGHPIHLTSSSTIERKHTCDPMVEVTCGVCLMDHGRLWEADGHNGEVLMGTMGRSAYIPMLGGPHFVGGGCVICLLACFTPSLS